MADKPKKARKPRPKIDTYIVGTKQLKSRISTVYDKKHGVGMRIDILTDPFGWTDTDDIKPIDRPKTDSKDKGPKVEAEQPILHRRQKRKQD